MTPLEFANLYKLTYILIETSKMVYGQNVFSVNLINMRNEIQAIVFKISSYKPAAIYQPAPTAAQVWTEILGYMQAYAETFQQLAGDTTVDDRETLEIINYARTFRDWLNSDNAWYDLINTVEIGD